MTYRLRQFSGVAGPRLLITRRQNPGPSLFLMSRLTGRLPIAPALAKQRLSAENVSNEPWTVAV
jgi:hypothetical protein